MISVVQSAFNDCALNITIVRLNTMVSFNAKIELRQHNFHLKIDNFTKVYVFVEDLEVRKMYVDLDYFIRLLFMFDKRFLIFLQSALCNNTKIGGESI